VLGPEIIEKIHGRIVVIAEERKVVKGQRIRLDTTVTETNIHYPTDSSLLGDGVRVLTRTMKRIVKIPQGAGERVRNRMRSVSHRVMEIARASRSKIQKQSKKRSQESYKQLLHSTGQVVAQAKRIAPEVDDGVKKAKKRIDQVRLEALKAELDRMIPVTQQVMRQTKARIFKNDLHAPNKLVSLFGNSHADYPQREIGEADGVRPPVQNPGIGRPIITHYEDCNGRPPDSNCY